MATQKVRILASERKPEEISLIEILYEEFGISGVEENGTIKLDPGYTIPPQQQLDQAKERYYAKIRSIKYKEERYSRYPSIVEQLDMLYHDIVSGKLESGSWVTTIRKIKNEFPKTPLN